MSDLLVIVGAPDGDDDLLEQVVRRHPRRVTVLVEQPDGDWAGDDSQSGQATRDRLARLLDAIDRRTDATVLGLAGDRDQLRGWRFDRVVGERAALAA